MAEATLGGGCFWCLEAVYQGVQGISAVKSGYAGGTLAQPTYRQVCTGRTGHAEVVQITFDPGMISYADLLGGAVGAPDHGRHHGANPGAASVPR